MPGTMERRKPRTDGRTLRDRLSRLTFVEACKLLGPDAEQLLRLGGAYEFDLQEDIRWAGDLFRLRVGGVPQQARQRGTA